MAEVLAVPQVRADDSFFDLGGNSLRAMHLVNRIIGDCARDDDAALRAALLVAAIDEGTPSALAGVLAWPAGQPATLVEPPQPDTAHSWPTGLSASEERLWLAHALYPDSGAYHIVNAFEVHGPLDVPRLRSAVRRLVARHPALRTRYHFGVGPSAKTVDPGPRADFDVVPAADLSAACALARLEARRRYDLRTDALLRVRVYQVDDTTAVLLIVVHHIAADGWSMRIIFDDLSAAYASQSTLAPPTIAPDRQAAPDPAAEQWWASYLYDPPDRLDLEPARTRPPGRQFEGDLVDTVLTGPTVAALQKLARAQRTSLFVVLLAALEVTLRCRSGLDRFIVGTVTASRDQAAAEDAVGFFANTVPVIAEPHPDLTFTELVRQVRAVWTDVLGHAHVPFERIATLARRDHDPSRAPLLDVVLVVQSDDTAQLRLAGSSCSPLGLHNGTAKFDLMLEAESAVGGFRLRWEYSTEALSRGTVMRLAEVFAAIVTAVTARPAALVSDLIAPDEQERRMLARLDGGHRDLPAASVPELFDCVAVSHHDKLAVVDGAVQLTFGQLDELARTMAGHLRTAHGIGQADRVGIVLPRSASWLAAMLAVARLGAVIVPVDPGYPDAARAQILALARPKAVVDAGSLPDTLGRPTRTGSSGAVAGARIEPDDALYLIFTSGSSGQPKGVLASHRGLLNRCAWAARALPYLPGERAIARTPAGFVDMFAEVFAPLLAGVPVILSAESDAADVDRLTRLVQQAGATRLLLTPSLLAAILDSPLDLAGRLRGLRVCALSGEPLAADLARRARLALPATRLINLYGSSELAGDATWLDLATLPAAVSIIPVGLPIDNTSVRVVDSSMRPVPPGVPGEIVVGGGPVALGYLDDEAKVATFLPFGQGAVRQFRTGDVGMVGTDGALVYLGRADRQLKIRGCRVEPDHVRAVLLSLDGVRDAAVIGRAGRTGHRLEAYVVAEEAGAIAASQLRAQLTCHLPGYLVPAAIEIVPGLPTTRHGKRDDRGLAAAHAEPGTGPAGPLERAVARVWEEVLGLASVGRDDDFFSLGGDSLEANRVVALVAQATGCQVPLRAFLRQPTVSGLASSVASAGYLPTQKAPAVAGLAALTPAQRQLWFFERLAPHATSYHVPLAVWVGGQLDQAALRRAIAAVLVRHDALRQVFGECDGQPTNYLSQVAAVDVPFVQAADETAALALARAFAMRPFPPGEIRVRAAVFATPAAHLLVLVLHHLVCDGASLWLILDDIAAQLAPAAPPLPAAPQFSVAADAVRRAAGDRQHLLRELAGRLAGYPLQLDIAGARAPAHGRRYLGDVVSVAVPADVAACARRLAADLAVSVAAVTLAAYAAVLEAASGTSRFLVSVPVADRTSPDRLTTVGFLVNSVPAAVALGSGDRFTDAVAMAARSLAVAWRHHDVPLTELVEYLNPDRVPGRNPLCQVEYAFQVVPAELPRLGGSTARLATVGNGGAKFELSLDVVSQGDDLSAHFEYDLDCLDRELVAALAGAFVAVLTVGTAEPSLPLSELPLCELPRLVRAGQRDERPDATVARAVPLISRIERQFAEHPGRIAVDAGHGRLSYADLDRQSASLARQLRARGAGRGERVALVLPRGAAAVVAITAVLRAGASVACMADSTPPARLRAMLGRVAPRVVITGPPLSLASGGPDARPAPADEAYVAFTSGSTGAPRGVSIGRPGLELMVIAWGIDYGLEADPGRHLQVASMSFDVFLGDLFRALAFGGTIVTMADDEALDAAVLLERLSHADTVELVPAVARMLVAYARSIGARLPALRRIIVGSERWETGDCQALLAASAPETLVINSYGTTETTIDSTRYEVRLVDLPVAGSVPIGTPLPGVLTSVRDCRGRELPPGLAGELWIGGPTVGLGYLGAEQGGFLSLPDGRWYRTGDLAAWRHGELVHLGRRDGQLKVRGVRIEPAEVEHALREHHGVREATVTAGPGASQGLAAFVVTAAGVTATELRVHLRQYLPDAAIPTRWHVLDRLPRTASGSIDRKALGALGIDSPGQSGTASPPATELASVIARIWGNVLGIEGAGQDTDFFESGGHSLQAAQLAWRLGEALGSHVGVAHVLAHPTPAAFIEGLGSRFEPGPASQAAQPAEPRTGNRAVAATPARHPPRSVMLTGATGFIGSEVLACLLDQDIDVLALVRARNKEEARLRLTEALRRHGHDPLLADAPRLRVLAGRLDQQGLGLLPGDYESAVRCDAIVNAAAWVSFALPYDWLAAVNVDGVSRLADLACAVVRSPVHHLSTRSAFDAGPRGAGGYNQTKAAAERLLTAAATDGLPVACYRPGFVAAAMARDSPWPSHHLVWRFLAECLRLGVAPDLAGDLDLMPVDVVAQAVIDGVLGGVTGPSALGNPRPLPWAAVWRDLAGAGMLSRTVPPAAWLDLVRNEARAAGGECRFEPFIGLAEVAGLDELLSERSQSGGGSVSCPPMSELWPVYRARLAHDAQIGAAPGSAVSWSG